MALHCRDFGSSVLRSAIPSVCWCCRTLCTVGEEIMVNKIAKICCHWLSYFSQSHKAGAIRCNLCFLMIWEEGRSSSLIKLENGWSECTWGSINTRDMVESKAVGTWIMRCFQKRAISFFFSSCGVNLGKTKKHQEYKKIQVLTNRLIFTGPVMGTTLKGQAKPDLS